MDEKLTIQDRLWLLLMFSPIIIAIGGWYIFENAWVFLVGSSMQCVIILSYLKGTFDNANFVKEWNSSTIKRISEGEK